MSGWRWLVVAVCVVLVVAMVAYARGEQQRGEAESRAPVLTVVGDRSTAV